MDEIQDPTLGEEIDRLHAEHHRYAQRLEELVQKPYLSEDEQLEEVRLKKLKLHAKDLIFALQRQISGDRLGRYPADLQSTFLSSAGPQGPSRGECLPVTAAAHPNHRIIVRDNGS
jgi:hypothetical protein